VSSLSLTLHVTLFTDPDRAYLSQCQNVPSLPGISPREVETTWIHVKDMLVVFIDKTWAADESMRTYVTNDGESVDWLAESSSASSHPVNKSSFDFADEEITLWRMRIQALPSHKNPLTELRAHLFSGFMDCPLGEESFRCTCHFCCPRAHVCWCWNHYDQKTDQINLRSF